MDYFRDPGYEYPPEPEIRFTNNKRNGNDDTDNGDDDDDDFDDIKSDNKNSKTKDKQHNEMGAKFNTNKGMTLNEIRVVKTLINSIHLYCCLQLNRNGNKKSNKESNRQSSVY